MLRERKRERERTCLRERDFFFVRRMLRDKKHVFLSQKSSKKLFFSLSVFVEKKVVLSQHSSSHVGKHVFSLTIRRIILNVFFSLFHHSSNQSKKYLSQHSSKHFSLSLSLSIRRIISALVHGLPSSTNAMQMLRDLYTFYPSP